MSLRDKVPEPKLRVVLADDQDLFRDGLAMLLEDEADIEVIGHARDGREAVELIRTLRPHLLVLDVSMPGMTALDVTSKLRTQCPRTLVVVLTAHEETTYLHPLLAAGARGYVLKRSAEGLPPVLRQVAAGATYIDPRLSD